MNSTITYSNIKYGSSPLSLNEIKTCVLFVSGDDHAAADFEDDFNTLNMPTAC